ncbi:MAG TPA: bifunctional nuclease family protein [Thermodesulfobacteriota bacterium]|nr:bifunctional nuclease family protein [Thermodesulfobacteriota bacterium]
MRKLYFLSALFISLAFSLSVGTQEKQNKVEEEEMVIKGIGFDQQAQTPVVVLSDKKQEKLLPIWVGLCEARSIELGLSNQVAPRPLTYDMIAAIVRSMNAKVKRIVIVDLRDQVFYAQIEVSVNGTVSTIDARPSDALALASRMGAPIFVRKSVLEKSAAEDEKEEKRGT